MAMLRKARWQRRCPRGTGRGRREEGRARHGMTEAGALPSSPPPLGWNGGGKGWFRRSRGPLLGPGWVQQAAARPPPPPTRHSLLRHPGVLEGDEDQVQTLQPRAVELSVELISQLLLQLAVILFCVHLVGQTWASELERPGLQEGRLSTPWGAGWCGAGMGVCLGSIPSSLGSLAKKLRTPGGLPGPSSPAGRGCHFETSSLLLDLGKRRLPQG